MAKITKHRARKPIADGTPHMGILPNENSFTIDIPAVQVNAKGNRPAITITLKDYELIEIIKTAFKFVNDPEDATYNEGNLLRQLALVNKPQTMDELDPIT